jgi:hypothetical protein
MVLCVCAIAALSTCNGLFNYKGLESAEGAIPSNLSQEGLTFYPDGYGKLSYVTYYPVSFRDGPNRCWGTNSDGANYSGITWKFTPPSSSDAGEKATLNFDYPNGDFEIYTLYNLKPIDGYRGDFYYEYEGHTGGATYTYDGSWDLDPDLNNTHGLIVVWDEGSYTVSVKVNNDAAKTIYKGQCFVKKVPFGTYTIKINYGTSSRTDTPTISAYNWYYGWFID